MGKAPKLLMVTYEDFSRLSYLLWKQIEEEHKKEPFEVIVSISRGGALVSRILSDLMDLPIYEVGISSYVSINDQKDLKVTQKLNGLAKGKKVLLVDEVCDSGRTFLLAIDEVKKIDPKVMKTVCLHYKPHSKYRPDYIQVETSDWVVYPYEFRETVEALGEFLKEDGLVDRLREYYAKLGLDEKMVDELIVESN